MHLDPFIKDLLGTLAVACSSFLLGYIVGYIGGFKPGESKTERH